MRELLHTKQYVEFLVGRDGDFDIFAVSVLRRCKRQYRSDNSYMVLALPYMKVELRDKKESYREYFDEIEIFSGSHFKSAFQQRNRDMLSRSNLAVFSVNKNEGGAYSAMKYAAAQGIETINLYEVLEEEQYP